MSIFRNKQLTGDELAARFGDAYTPPKESIPKSDTPRTDAALEMYRGPVGMVPADFARKLERENASLHKTIKALKNPNRCPNCHVAYTPKTCPKPCNGPGGAFPCDYPKCVGK